MPHPPKLTPVQIVHLVAEREENAKSFRALGFLYGISKSTAYNYYSKHKNATKSINSEGEQVKDETLDAEILSWQEWFSHEPEPSKTSINPPKNHKHRYRQLSHGYNHVDEGVDDNSEQQRCSPLTLTRSNIFSDPTGKKKR